MARLKDRERNIAGHVEAAEERAAKFSAQLREFHRLAGEISITRKTLLDLF